MKRIKLIYIAAVDPSGQSGQNVTTLEIASALARRDEILLTMICPKPRNAFRPTWGNSVSFKYLPEKKSGSHLWHVKVQGSIFRTMLGLIQKEKPAGIIARFGPSMFIPPLLAGLMDIPYILLLRGMSHQPTQGIQAMVREFIQECIVKRINTQNATSVYAAFLEIAQEVSNNAHSGAPEVYVFPNAVDPRKFKSYPIQDVRGELKLGLEPEDFVVGFVGSLKERHGLSMLIDAFHAFCRAGGSGKLIIVGEGPLWGWLKNKVGERGLSRRVILTGYVAHYDVHRYINACDVMYGVVDMEQPSNPIKCYEYLACGRPLITTAKEEFSFVEEINAGVILPHMNVDEVLAALQFYRQLPRENRLRMGANGREYVLEHHTWDHLGELILRDLAKNHG